jgi:hypothetical protein
MTNAEFADFMDAFRRVAAVFERYPQRVEQMHARADQYFHVLKRHPLALVVAKADQWIARESKMPKPAEWAGVIVSSTATRPPLPDISQEEADEYRRAERLRWRDDPCDCLDCQAAGVTTFEVRFVPRLDRDGAELQAHLDGRCIGRGVWLHGAALLGWYLAREHFWSQFTPRTMPQDYSTDPQSPDARASRQDTARRLLARRSARPAATDRLSEPEPLDDAI